MGGDSAVQSHSMGGVRGGEEAHTHTHTHTHHTHTHTGTHTHTQERTRECCTYPLATYPLKSARLVVSRGYGAFNCQSSGLSRSIQDPSTPNSYGFQGASIVVSSQPQFLGVVSPHLPVGKKFLRFCLV